MKRQTARMFIAVSCLLICFLSGCMPSESTILQQLEYPSQTTATTIAPTVTTAPNEPANVPFDPAAWAARVPKDLKQEMKQAYKDQFFSQDSSVTPESVYIEQVFAIFGETIVLFVDGFDYAQVETSETVNGMEFRYGSAQPLEVYSEGRYYALQEAFVAQIISAENLSVIYVNYYSIYPQCDSQ